jgi:hypothetical protein
MRFAFSSALFLVLLGSHAAAWHGRWRSRSRHLSGSVLRHQEQTMLPWMTITLLLVRNRSIGEGGL